MWFRCGCWKYTRLYSYHERGISASITMPVGASQGDSGMAITWFHQSSVHTFPPSSRTEKSTFQAVRSPSLLSPLGRHFCSIIASCRTVIMTSQLTQTASYIVSFRAGKEVVGVLSHFAFPSVQLDSASIDTVTLTELRVIMRITVPLVGNARPWCPRHSR